MPSIPFPQAPDADGPTIKRAYYSIMRDCHPDQSGEDNDEATEFCKMLNEIYEVGADQVNILAMYAQHMYDPWS